MHTVPFDSSEAERGVPGLPPSPSSDSKTVNETMVVGLQSEGTSNICGAFDAVCVHEITHAMYATLLIFLMPPLY